MASALLAMSTVALATSVTVTVSSGDVSYDNTVSSGFSKSGATITWSQPYKLSTVAPDPVAMGYPEGGALQLVSAITSAKLTIVASQVSPVGKYKGYGNTERDSVSKGASKSGPWTAIVPPGPVYLTAAASQWGDSTTVITLSDANDWLNGTEGYFTQVVLTDYPANQGDTVKSARLEVAAHYTYTYTYTPKKVIFVSAQHASTADVNVPSDKGFVDLLEAAYYEVDYTPGAAVGTSYWETLDPNQLAALDAADLVIIGRDCNSGGVATDAAEVAAWTNVKAPVMLMSSYIAANNRWKWINSSTQDARIPYYMVKALDKTNPVFGGVTFDVKEVVVEPNDVVAIAADANDVKVDPNAVAPAKNVVLVETDELQWYDPNAASGYASFIKTADAGKGTVLAVRPDTGTILIAEWFPGKPFYATSGQIPASHRMFFNAGTQEVTSEKTNWGVMNLNAQGQKMFLNAVKYMTLPVPVPITVENASFEKPGTVKIKGWNGEGIAGTPAVDIPGWASDVNSPVADSGVETGFGATDGTWTAFLKGADPSIWQSTGFVIAADDVFALSVDARNTWQGTTLRVTMYYEDGGLRVPAATVDVAVKDAMQTFTLPFAANDVPAAVGKIIGIELDNVTTNGDSWIGLDNVWLTVK
jgi:hypothetical protein